MKRHLLIFGLLLLGLAAGAQGTNPAAALADDDSFRIISQRNIFDKSRRGGVSHIHHVPVIDELVLLGAADDKGAGTAFFSGSDRPLKVGDTVDGLKLVKMGFDSVELSGASNTFVLKMDGERALRREDNGPWQVSDAPEPERSAAPPSSADSTSASTPNTPAAPLSSATESDVEKRLRLKREQEDK